eukprot:TRINITY_DN16904_c0_g1_i1.p1 TRINITY_DN16904_c0_g1~~TRINITY_DN16904_c0_g1_i1.p1  ORF type:complete len:144 (+),score=54.67 TRINITY_DN16904_c0_g1_i1:56-433(+)
MPADGEHSPWKNPWNVVSVLVGICVLYLAGPIFLCDDDRLVREIAARSQELTKVRGDVGTVVKQAEKKLKDETAKRDAQLSALQADLQSINRRVAEAEASRQKLRDRMKRLQENADELQKAANGE